MTPSHFLDLQGRPSLCRTVGNLQVTPVLTQDGRYLPEVTISKKDCRALPSTYSPAVFTKDGRRAWPSLPTLPGTDGTIGRRGPGVRTGRLGTLYMLVNPIGKSECKCYDISLIPLLVSPP